MGPNTMPMTELNGFPHSLRSATANSLDSELSQEYIQGIDGKIGPWDTNNHQESIDPMKNS